MLAKAIILGNVGRKEKITLSDNSYLTKLSIVTKRTWIDTSKEKHVVESWHHVLFYTNLSMVAFNKTTIGQLVYIEGDIENSKHSNADNKLIWHYRVIGNLIRPLPSQYNHEREGSYD